MFMDVNNHMKMTLELPRENWATVLRALQSARTATSNEVEQDQLDRTYQLINNALNDPSIQQLLKSPMEVQSNIPIQVKVVTGDWT